MSLYCPRRSRKKKKKKPEIFSILNVYFKWHWFHRKNVDHITVPMSQLRNHPSFILTKLFLSLSFRFRMTFWFQEFEKFWQTLDNSVLPCKFFNCWAMSACSMATQLGLTISLIIYTLKTLESLFSCHLVQSFQCLL